MRRGTIIGLLALLVVGGAFVATRLPGDEPTRDGRPPPVELLAENLVLFGGEEAAVRISFEPADPSARLIASLQGEGALSFCPLARIEDPLPPLTECRDAQSGVRESVSRQDLGAVAIVLRGAGEAFADLRIEFAERGRGVTIWTPRYRRSPDARGCRDAGCETFFELVPVRRGTLRARASWKGGSAELQILQGRVRARSLSATGIPYTVAAREAGASPLAVSAATAADAEYALMLLDPVAGPDTPILQDVVIDASWE